MPTVPFDITDANNVPLWRFDEGGTLIRLDADGHPRLELGFDETTTFVVIKDAVGNIRHQTFLGASGVLTQILDANGVERDEVKLGTTGEVTRSIRDANSALIGDWRPSDGGLSEYRPGGAAYAQAWAGGFTAYDDQGNVTGQLP